MTEPLARARALLEHFKSQVSPQAQVTPSVDGDAYGLSIPVVVEHTILVWVAVEGNTLCVHVCASGLPQSMSADDIARVGGMLIQISNLVRQIRALAGGNTSDRGSAQAAVS